jgi:hypothetical protein
MDLFLEMEQLFDTLCVRNFDPYCSYNRNENDVVLDKMNEVHQIEEHINLFHHEPYTPISPPCDHLTVTYIAKVSDVMFVMTILTQRTHPRNLSFVNIIYNLKLLNSVSIDRNKTNIYIFVLTKIKFNAFVTTNRYKSSFDISYKDFFKLSLFVLNKKNIISSVYDGK